MEIVGTKGSTRYTSRLPLITGTSDKRIDACHEMCAIYKREAGERRNVCTWLNDIVDPAELRG